MSGQVVVITVAGEMDRVLRAEFDEAETTVEHSVTQMRFVDVDPSALHGVIHRIEALGLELLDIHHGDDAQSPRQW